MGKIEGESLSVGTPPAEYSSEKRVVWKRLQKLQIWLTASCLRQKRELTGISQAENPDPVIGLGPDGEPFIDFSGQLPAASLRKRVIAFGEPAGLSLTSREHLGNKGEGLYNLAFWQLPVPAGFTIPTEACIDYYLNNQVRLVWKAEIESQVTSLEEKTQKKLGDPDRPLFVAVRSGASISLPGMMDTFLNVGLNSQTLPALAGEIGEIPANKAYYKLMADFARKIFKIEEEALAGIDKIDSPQEQIDCLLRLFQERNLEFPQDPQVQLDLAIKAVFESARTPAVIKKILEHYPLDGLFPAPNFSYSDFIDFLKTDPQLLPGRLMNREMVSTGVTVMEMVWGNKEDGTLHPAFSAVVFTSDPNIGGEPVFHLRYQAQGDEVVGDEISQKLIISQLKIPEKTRKQLFLDLERLERLCSFPQDVELVWDGNNYYFIQTRNAHLQPLAQFRFTLSNFRENESVIWLNLISLPDLSSLIEPGLDRDAVSKARVIAIGEGLGFKPASGAVSRSLRAEPSKTGNHEPIVRLCRMADLADEVPPNTAAIVFEDGSRASHGVRLVEGEGLPVIVGTGDLVLQDGVNVTVDPLSGRIYEGIIPLEQRDLTGETGLTLQERETVLEWLKARRSNPWFFAGLNWERITGETEAYERRVKEKIAMIQREPPSVSLKAREYTALNAVISPEWREEYEILSPEEFNDPNLIRQKILAILATGQDASFRTCHKPAKQGTGPWAPITSMADLEKFLSQRDYYKYGGYPVLTSDSTLTEALIGQFPNGKLNPERAREHAIWTLEVADDSTLTLTVIPFTAQLRDLEFAEKGNKISYKFSKTELGSLNTGENLRENNEAQEMFFEIAVTVSQWLKQGLISSLAACQEFFPRFEEDEKPRHRTIVLEGQHGPGWTKIYGLKADLVRKDDD